MKTDTLTPESARVKASRLRRKRKPLTPTQSAWLAQYTATTKKPGATKPTIEMKHQPHGVADSARVETSTADASDGPAPSYADQTWIPVTPADAETGDKEEPIADGQDKAAQAAALDIAAKKIGGLFALLTAAGLASAKELAAAGELPIGNEILAAGIDKATESALIAHVAEAGARVAKKYGLSTAWEYEDEATVLLAAFGSAFCIRAARKMKQPAAPLPTSTPTTPTPEQLEFGVTKPKKPTDEFKSVMGIE